MIKVSLKYVVTSGLILLAHTCFSQGDRKFTGQLVLLDGNQKSLNNVPVRLKGLGAGATGTDGLFTIAIKNGINSVTLELVNSNMDVIYPPAGIASVPVDQDEIIKFIIGDSPKDILTRAVARSNNELKDRLAQLGVKQDGIEQTLVSFIDSIQKMSNIKLSDLRNEMDMARKRQDFYPTLAAAINNYTNEAKDLKDAFKFTANHAFDDAQALQLLTNAVNSYNEAFEEINKKHNGYEKMVLDLWDSEAKATEVKDLFSYALGELHSANIFTLNLKIRDINEYNRGNMKGTKRKVFKETMMHEIEGSVLQLERRLQELDNRAQVVLSKLSI